MTHLLMTAKAFAEEAPFAEPGGPDTGIASLAELAEDEIAARAYSYWEARGFRGGSPDDDWQRAVEELIAERQK
jgi:hypothetical protein